MGVSAHIQVPFQGPGASKAGGDLLCRGGRGWPCARALLCPRIAPAAWSLLTYGLHGGLWL